eukprot:TRINITY_DN2516_c0_g1_i3.p1 TRINITY_DN2516_c0_g1~~TRINITY_DN2516_c0_g1_i3.p1  ORF type:complete len:338 (-),score=65.57 TRINITY_DN2516_c0_g1_i3:2-958(-)
MKPVIKILVPIIAFTMAVGISYSGMVNTSRSLNFFNISKFGSSSYDFSLLFALSFALLPNLIFFNFLKGDRPLFEDKFNIPTSSNLDQDLVLGSVLFGIGWGLSLYCPGPSVINSFMGNNHAINTTISMVLGWYINHYRRTKKRNSENDKYLIGAISLLFLLYLLPDVTLRFSVLPQNYLVSAFGGLTIGTSVILFMKLIGRILGLSGMFGNLFSTDGTEKDLKILFVIGFAIGSLFIRFSNPALATSNVVLPFFSPFIGGLLVGLGTGMASGCTSGHGVCGMSRLSPRSLVATLTFFISTIVSVSLLSSLGYYGSKI